MMDHNRIIVGGYSWIEVENLIGVSPSIHGLLIRPPDDNREFSGLLVPPVIIHDHQWTNCEKNRADELETRPTRNTSSLFDQFFPLEFFVQLRLSPFFALSSYEKLTDRCSRSDSKLENTSG